MTARLIDPGKTFNIFPELDPINFKTSLPVQETLFSLFFSSLRSRPPKKRKSPKKIFMAGCSAG